LRRAFWVLLCLSMMVACEESKVEILQRRLDNFRNILPSELREEFDSKNYQVVAKGIDSLLSAGSKLGQETSAFKERYERLKHDELIDVFSTEEVVDFFREHFVEEIERLKKKEDSS
jgi:hypothetical protein